MICAKAIYSDNSYKYLDLNIGYFPDSTPHITLKPIKDAAVYVIEWYYENDAELFQVMCINDKLAKYGPVDLFLPYIPNARMDRVKNEDDVFTLKTFCNAINSMQFCNVYVVDPHSNVSLALLDRVVARDIKDIIEYNIQDALDYDIAKEDNFILFYPDEGAMKRYSEMLKYYQYAFGIKNRDQTTGQITGYEVVNKELVNGKDVMIIDDICSRGGTFYHAAKALKELGANHIYLYVSHAEKAMIKGDMYNCEGLIDKIYTTNSIVGRIDPLNKIFVAEIIMGEDKDATTSAN